MSVKVFNDETTGKVVIRGVKVVPGQMDLIYRNFRGERTDYNDEGNRNFCIKVTEDDVPVLEQANIIVKRTKEDEPYFKVNVRYENVPPTVVRIKPLANGQKMKTVVDESVIGTLDRMLISDATISVSPYFSKKNKKWTCYLSAMMFTPLVDPVMEEIDALDSVYPTEDDDNGDIPSVGVPF